MKIKKALSLLLSFAIYNKKESRIKNFIRKILLKTTYSLHFRALVNQGDVVLQAGCYRIETVMKWSELVGPKGLVIVVEASKDNYNRLEYDVKRRDLRNVLLINKAIWDKKDKLHLEISEMSRRNKLLEQSSYSSMLTEKDYSGTEAVEADSIDSLLENHNIKKLDLAFFSISGAEREALKGMKKTLHTMKPRLFMRVILLDKETNQPVVYDVETQLKQEYEYTVLRPKHLEENRPGNNIFAWKR